MHLGHQLATSKSNVEEELQSRERGGRGALINQVQLKAPQFFNAGGVGSALEMYSEYAHSADIGDLGLFAKLVHAHVLDHALTSRRDGLT
ncbi:hypothetical protein Rfer_2707 [Rhodoferax ferrireducens T118]|uniref:Uncharacterized protein n=1 Tax=Albidiferax ferrireducens (strain ATCC BAA-621 / DSM 15236 / T118) TaxID=338969 RepID=Q21UY1_ALBFT|nr:hypothetical protein Rfer_2707 [Rhodoferax ferrireducens T118]